MSWRTGVRGVAATRVVQYGPARTKSDVQLPCVERCSIYLNALRAASSTLPSVTWTSLASGSGDDEGGRVLRPPGSFEVNRQRATVEEATGRMEESTVCAWMFDGCRKGGQRQRDGDASSAARVHRRRPAKATQSRNHFLASPARATRGKTLTGLHSLFIFITQSHKSSNPWLAACEASWENSESCAGHSRSR